MSNMIFVDQFNFKGFSEEMKLLTFVLAGCDYLKSIKGIGFKTAYKLVDENKSLQKVLATIQNLKKFKLENDYESLVEKTMLTFVFSSVYCEDS